MVYKDRSNLIVEFMSRFKLDYHGKSELVERPFRLNLFEFVIVLYFFLHNCNNTETDIIMIIMTIGLFNTINI